MHVAAARERAPSAEPAPATGALPLSARQTLLWLDEQLFPSAKYHRLVLTMELRGALDVPRFARAWADAVAARDALHRVADPREARQVRVTSPAPPLRVLDVAEPDLAGWVRAQALGPLGVAGSAWNAVLLRLSGVRHVFFFVQPHLFADGTSVIQLLEELAERYRGHAPPAGAPFDAYLAAEAAYRGSARAREDQAYWGAKVARGAPPIRPYGIKRTDTSAALVRDGYGAGAALSAALAARAAEEPFATLSPQLSRLVVLATGLVATLHRVSGNRELVLGVPVANRAPTFARTYGLLMEQLFLRVELDEGDTFETLARKLRREAIDSLRHGRWCVSDRGMEYVTLNVLDRLPTRFADLEATIRFDPATLLGGPDARAGDLRDTLAIQAFDFSAEHPLELNLDFHAATFGEDARTRFRRHLVRMLEGLADDPATPLDRVRLLDDGELRHVLRAARGPEPEGIAPDVVEAFAAQARRRASHVAVDAADARLTYAELDAASSRLAHRLRSLGVAQESRVGVAVPRGARELATLLAVLKAGAAYVPVDPAHPVDRVRLILEDAAPDVLVAPSDSPLLGALPAGTVHLRMDDLGEATRGWPDGPLAEAVAPDQLAYLLFTSGSTGRPKGVEVPRGAFANFLRAMAREPGLSETDRLLAITTTTFDIAGLELFLPLTVGATVVIADRDTVMDPVRLGARLAAERFSVMQATPATWRLLVEAGWKGSPGLRLLCGGEALSPELADALLARGAELWNLYGPTETTVWSTLDRVRAASQITVGHPIDHTRVLVLDAARHPVPVGVIGELYIGGRGLARGYRGRPELTAERFLPETAERERLYRTGDLARLLDDGRFECLGRVDHQVKLRGFRIELGEIESVLRGAPGVREAVVVADAEAPADPRLVAYFTGDADRRALFEAARARLPSFMIPSEFVPLEAFPLTPNGKIDRRALPRAPRSVAAVRPAGKRPADDTETRVAAIWRDVLGVPSVGVDEDFFALGGSSVLAIQVRARMEEELGVSVPLRAFFETPTVESLVRAVGRPGTASDPIVISLRRAAPGRPTLFCLLGVQLYQDLALSFDDDVAVVGMHVPIHRGRGPIPSVQEIAGRYVELIRRHQPSGPYLLGGLCFGGLVAFEAARQLEDAGEEVPVVGVFDTYLPAAVRVDRRARLWHHLRAAFTAPGATAAHAWSRLAGSAGRWARRTGAGLGGTDREIPLDGPDVVAAARRYAAAMRPLRGHLVVFRAAARDWPRWTRIEAGLGWSGYGATVSVHEVSCGHLEIVRDPHCRAIATEIAAVRRTPPPGPPAATPARRTTDPLCPA